MPRHPSVPVRSLFVLAFLLSTTATIAAGLAAGADADTVFDGVPSLAACRELGFDTSGAEHDVPGGAIGGAALIGNQAFDAGVVAPAPAARLSAEASALAAKGPMRHALVAAPAVDTERYPDATANPVKRVADEPVSTFSIDVDTASYANVRRFLNDGSLPPRDAVRVEELINYFDYGYPRPTSADTPFAVHVAVVASPWATGREIVHIGLQGYDIAGDARPPLNLVFLVDVSGSMEGADRLGLAQQALNVLIDQLRAEDRVALAVYAGAAGAVLGPTPGNHKLKLRCAVGALRAGGSTAGGAGLALAYAMAGEGFVKGAVNRVILLTDGDFNVGIADPQRLEDFVAEKRRTGIYLSVYGFGRGNYNDVMMQTLAQSGNGTAGYIDTLREGRKLFRDDFSGSFLPIADDVKIQIEFNPARVAEYRLIGYETRLLNREDFNNDQVDAGEVGAGASVTALYEITPFGGPLSIDPLRYQHEAAAAGERDELAYLKIRYKLPGGLTSQVIERPIGDEDRPATLLGATEATRWALAVAAFGQRLRGDPWMAPEIGWRWIADFAQVVRGEDPFGLRAEFVQLVRAAATAGPLNR